ATLNYTQDDSQARNVARDLVTRHPELATVDVHTMAATGAADELAEELRRSPELANADGGPFNWPPLLYLCYGRLGDLPGRSAVRTAAALLQAGADPNAGFLWRGLMSPFTALTGVFGGGEQDQPAHQHSAALARLLLEAGADPNDNQTLYNRCFRPANDHLRLLFGYGLGTDVDSPWRHRFGDHYPTVEQMITEQLRWAADAGMIERVQLLLDHRVPVDGRGYHPIFGDRTPYQLAVLAGNREIATLLADHGADTSTVGPADLLLGACLAGDAEGAQDVLRQHPSALQRVHDRWPDAVWRAADKGRIDGVRLLLEFGLDPNTPGRFGTTALHQAAHDGRTDLVALLLEQGADPTLVEDRFHSRPSGWADHSGQHDLAIRLRAAEEDWHGQPGA
ncbi:MAG TPA: ankyrin repeat domain-containing protein, partial [Microlunatus sp.]